MPPAKFQEPNLFNSEEVQNEHRKEPGGAWEGEEAAGD